MAGIGELAAKYEEKIRLVGPGAIFGLTFTDSEIWDMRDAFARDSERYFLFRRLLLDRGIHIFPTEKGLWYLSTAHTDEDIEHTLKVVDEAFSILKGL
jgi:glutamate-1-semialdehyde 2,1-aminomutase